MLMSLSRSANCDLLVSGGQKFWSRFDSQLVLLIVINWLRLVVGLVGVGGVIIFTVLLVCLYLDVCFVFCQCDWC